IDLLLQAFAQILRKHRRARLLLKGLDSLYASQQYLDADLANLSAADARLVRSRLNYNGDSLTFAILPQLYYLADCYVTPYSGEGFNLPALEAAACGTPVICTAGGPTDDFVTDDFARRIDSQIVDARDP